MTEKEWAKKCDTRKIIANAKTSEAKELWKKYCIGCPASKEIRNEICHAE